MDCSDKAAPGQSRAKLRREWLLASFVVAAACAMGQPLFASVKTHVICTESEPADAPTHFRFENSATLPEVILELDYSTAEEAKTPWVVGQSYNILIDDDFEAASVGKAMYSARAECTAEGRDKFRLRSAPGSPSMTCSLNWASDPTPTVKPWTRARAYLVQILEIPKKIDIAPSPTPPTPKTP